MTYSRDDNNTTHNGVHTIWFNILMKNIP